MAALIWRQTRVIEHPGWQSMHGVAVSMNVHRVEVELQLEVDSVWLRTFRNVWVGLEPVCSVDLGLAP